MTAEERHIPPGREHLYRRQSIADNAVREWMTALLAAANPTVREG